MNSPFCPPPRHALAGSALLAFALFSTAASAQPMPPPSCQTLSNLHGIVHGQGFGLARPELQSNWRRERCNARPDPLVVPVLCQTLSDQFGLGVGGPPHGFDREASGSFAALGCGTRPLHFHDCQGMSDVYGVFHGQGFGMAPERARDNWKRSRCQTQPSAGAVPRLCQVMSDRYQMASGQTFGYADNDVQASWRAMGCNARPAHPIVTLNDLPPARGPGYAPPPQGPPGVIVSPAPGQPIGTAPSGPAYGQPPPPAPPSVTISPAPGQPIGTAPSGPGYGPPPPQAPPPPPMASEADIPGEYNCVHKDWRGRITFARDGRFVRENGDPGSWRLEGPTLVMKWDNWGVIRLDPTGPNSYRASSDGFAIQKRGAIPPPPTDAPPPPPSQDDAPPAAVPDVQAPPMAVKPMPDNNVAR